MKKKWIIIICAAVGAFALLFGIAAFVVVKAMLTSAYTLNKADKDVGLEVADRFYLCSAEDTGFSFLYPESQKAAWSDGEGAYIYCGDEGKTPYVLICRSNKAGMNPDRYFKTCDNMMLDKYPDVKSTPIQEVKVGDKTLYLVRYVSGELVIDRYLELYRGFYIQYTAISSAKGSLNTELYYAISTLRTGEGAYSGAYSDSVSVHKHEDLDLTVSIPDMLETKDLTIGYFASCKDAILLTVRIDSDDNGKAIYNRQDFIDRAAESPDFVAGLLGADSAVFTNGRKVQLGGTSFYSYPMDMMSGDEAFSGALCLANADETGCWLVCYAVRSACPAYKETLALLEKCTQSIEIEKGNAK